MRWLLMLGLALLAGCGYVGDPLPPALMIPVSVEDLSAVQRGSKLILRFSRPRVSTEGIGLTEPGEVEVRIGPPLAGPFDAAAWAASASAAAFEVLEDSSNETRLRAALDPAHTGKEVFAALRVKGPKSRWSSWSNVLAFTVLPEPPGPRELKPEAVPQGVRLTWSPLTERYRVWRRAPKDKDMTELATADQQPFVDTTAEFGTPYEYQVQNIAVLGGSQAESELSSKVSITPEDTFAPAPPVNVSAIAGINAVELAWDRNAEPDLRGYQVYRGEEDRPMEKVSGVLDTPAFRDSAAASGKRYRYVVTAVDQKSNESARSAETTVTAP